MGRLTAAELKARRYWYSVTRIVQVHDGDTFTCDLDVGDCITRTGIDVRLIRINAPELKTADNKSNPAGVAAREHLKVILADKPVIIGSKKREKYGRFLAEVFVLVGKDALNVNDQMIADGHAIRIEG